MIPERIDVNVSRMETIVASLEGEGNYFFRRKLFLYIAPVHIVSEFVERGIGDDVAKAHSQREESLRDSCEPHLTGDNVSIKRYFVSCS